MRITVPALNMGQIDAVLAVEPDDHGDSYAITLSVLGRVIARGEEFRPGPLHDFGDPADARITVETFGAFLAHAIESSEDDARDGWSVLTDDASDWTDALTLFGYDDDEDLGSL